MTTTKPKIKSRSNKRAKQEREYAKIRKQFLQENPICQVKGCEAEATEAHHRAGRSGERLTDVSLFLAVCRKCHDKIELNPTWAKHMGYSLSRLSKD